MSDETRRPGSVGEGEIPAGTRARNGTVLLGSENTGSLRSSLDDQSLDDVLGIDEAGSPVSEGLPLNLFEGDEYVSLTRDDDTLQSLDEIFGTSHAKTESAPSPVDSAYDDPFAFAGVLDEPVAPPAPSTSSQPMHEAHPEIDESDDMLGGLAEVEETPIVQAPMVEAAPAGIPKIVRPGEGGTSHNRIIAHPEVIIPPEAPPVVPHVQPIPVAVQTQKEAKAMTEPRDIIYWKNESPLAGFLVTYDLDPKGSYVELRQGRLMVSNEREESGSCLVVVGDSVSPMHAIMRVASGGVVQVLDQLSEAGTRVKHMGQHEEEFLSGEKSTLSHGDIVFFGDRKFHVLLVVGEE